jgi:hypothetical protein
MTLDSAMMYAGYFCISTLLLVLAIVLFVVFILPAIQSMSMALLVVVSLIKTRKLGELNWLKFPGWLWTYYRGFQSGQISGMSYKVEGTQTYCEWVGVFDWRIIEETPAPTEASRGEDKP